MAENNSTPGQQASQELVQDSAPLEEVLSRPVRIGASGREAEHRIDGVVIGHIVACTGTGEVLVDYPGNPGQEPRAAITVTVVQEGDLQKEVALSFVGGDPLQPVLLGLVTHPARGEKAATGPEPARVELDGETLVFNAQKEIVLKCGKASITLTRAGKILIKGTYTSTQSTGVNRIRGGSVQVN